MRADQTDCTVDAGGVRTRVRRAGSGEAVLLVHGFADGLSTWWRTVPTLSQRYGTMAYDLHGCGASEKGAGRYDLASLGRQALGVLDALQITRAHVVGHSLGAKVALMAAALAPGRVRSLVLEAPPAYAMPLPWELRLLTAPWLGELLAACATPWSTRIATRRAFLRMLHPASRTWSEERFRRLPRDVADPRAMVKGWMHLARGIRLDAGHVLEEAYARMTVPALVVVGERDPDVPPRLGRRLAAVLPRARLVSFAETGHIPHAECEREFNEVLLAFFAEVEAAEDGAREVPGGG